MAHKVMVGGTAYQISSGKSMVDGTVYEINRGRTLVGGTGYEVSFVKKPQAMLYQSGNIVFQLGGKVDSGETLVSKYNFSETESNGTAPWHSSMQSILNASFKEGISPTNLAGWFSGASNLTSINHEALDKNNITNMAYMFNSCYSLVDTAFSGSNVTNMAYAYYNCSNVNGTAKVGNNVSNLYYAYYGSKVSGAINISPSVSDVTGAFYGTNISRFRMLNDSISNIDYTFGQCRQLMGNVYITANNITNAYHCFINHNNYRRLNIVATKNSQTFRTLINNSKNAFGRPVNFRITNGTNILYANQTLNIYIYGTRNVNEFYSQFGF